MQLKPIPLAFMSIFALSPSSQAATDVTEFAPVIVTANKVEQPLSKTNGSVAVVTSEELEREGATELYDALSNEPGVSVSGGAGRPQNITIRGMSGNRIAVVKDGVRVADGYGANDINDVAGFNSFDLGDIKQIEVVKGAGSSLYGSGAIGGVVVLTSKSPEDYLGNDDSYMGVEAGYSGISDKYTTALTAARRLGNTDHLLRLSYWQGSETKNHAENLYQREIDGFNAALTSEWFVNDAWLLKGKGEYYRQNATRRDGIAPVQEDGGGWQSKTFLEDNETSTLLAKVSAEWAGRGILADQAALSAYYRHTENNGDKDIAMHRQQEGLEYQRRQMESRQFTDTLYGASAEMLKQGETGGLSHHVAWGIELEWLEHQRPIQKTLIDWNGNRPKTYAPFAAATTQRAGLYLHDVIDFGAWNITPSLRFDYQHLSPSHSARIGSYDVKESTSSELSPSLSVGYQWTDTFNTYLSYNHGFRAPSYDKAYGYVPHLSSGIANFIIKPNADLEAETSDNIELGSKYDDGRLSVYAAVFYSVFDNFISYKTTGWNDELKASEVQYLNLDGVKTYGAELTAGYWLASSVEVVTKLGIVDGEDDQGEPIRNLTPLEGNTQINYHGGVDAFVRVNYAASMDRVPSCTNSIGMKAECATTPGWMSVDMGAGYDITPDFRVNVAINNLFDSEYTRYQDVAGVSKGSVLYSTEPGRYFNINAKYSF